MRGGWRDLFQNGLTDLNVLTVEALVKFEKVVSSLAVSISHVPNPPHTHKKKNQKNQYKITFSAITVSRALICHIAMASTLHPILYFPLYFRYISPASTEILCTRLWIPATVRSVVPVLLAPLPGGGEFIVIINSLPGTCKYETLHAGARLIQAVRFYWTMAGRTRASISLARHYQNY